MLTILACFGSGVWEIFAGCGWFWVAVGGFGWMWVVSAGCGWLWLVPHFSMYPNQSLLYCRYILVACLYS